LHRTLAGYARHPNFGGILMIGLGCEVNQLTLYGQKGIAAGKRHFNIQERRLPQMVERAMDVLREICEEVGPLKREPIPVSEIVVGLQCGGSDGMSGITANPALGAAVDILAAGGGTGILSETTEIYGAEHLLASRATTPEVAAKLDGLIKWWRRMCRNTALRSTTTPSPGNKRGGLTTILEKSLGAVAKAGSTPLTAVYNYAEKVTEHGLVFMDTPGYDPVSATGRCRRRQCHQFTTGRGSCFGCHPTPSIKVATNSTLYRSMEEDMDVDCGVTASGDKRRSNRWDMRSSNWHTIVETASGRKTKSEQFGYGDNEFVPWHLGATL
jgi:altronate hydrolase